MDAGATRALVGVAIAVCIAGCSKTKLQQMPRDTAAADASSQDAAGAHQSDAADGMDAGPDAGLDAGLVSDAVVAHEPDGATDACVAGSDHNWHIGMWKEQRLERTVSAYATRHPRIALLPDGGIAVAYHLSGLSVSSGLYVLRLQPDGGFSELRVADMTTREGHAVAARGDDLVLSYLEQGELRVWVEEAEGWRMSFVDDALGELPPAPRTAIAVDAGGAVHVAYFAASELRYATDAGGSFRSERVANVTMVTELDLALDRAGRPHITYQTMGDGGRLHYAAGPPPFELSDVTSEPIYAHALTIDSNDVVYIGLLRTWDQLVIELAQQSGSGWDFVPLPSHEQPLTALAPATLDVAIDSHNRLHLASLTPDGVIYYVGATERWSSELVGDLPEGPLSLAVDSAGATHIVTTQFRFPDDRAIHYHTNRVVQLDGRDDDCDGVDGVDQDGDGHASLWTGGDDCDDRDAAAVACTP